MKLLKEILERNRILAIMGAFFLVLAAVLACYAMVNTVKVLGINSMLKPIKFALSTSFYAWSMAYLLFYLNNQRAVKWYSILALVTMFFENGIITIQALLGKRSHFNVDDTLGEVLYGIMGVMIVWLTTATLVIAIRFIRQKTYRVNKTIALSIKLGLILFVVFSFFGGYLSAVNSHNVGGEMGKEGLFFLDWSHLFGDLRVGHFFGIHSLQAIPLFGFFISSKSLARSDTKLMVWLFTLTYTSFVCFTIWQALNGKSLFGL
ncbi:MAG: hypothetical protein ACI9QN_001611 [Arcticibacterium sp.]|jgi:hypothetical protein